MPGIDYRAIAQTIHESLDASGQEITSLSEDELRALVNAVAEGIQTALDKLEVELQRYAQSQAAHQVQVEQRRRARRR